MAERTPEEELKEHIANNTFVRLMLKRQNELIHRQNEQIEKQVDLTRDLHDIMCDVRDVLRDFRNEVRALRELVQSRTTNGEAHVPLAGEPA